MKKPTLFLMILLLPLSLAALDTGGYAGAYLRMAQGARAMAMGNSTASLPNDLESVFENPAILASLEDRQMISAFQFLSLDRSMNSLAMAFPLPPSAAVAVGWVHAGVKEIEGRNASNQLTENYSSSQDALFLAFSNFLSSWLSAGLTIKVFYDQLPEVSATGLGIDAGIYLQPMEGLSFAFVAKDIRSNISWDTRKIYDFGSQRTDTFPRQYLLSAAWNYQRRLLFTGTFKGSTDILPTCHIGLELPLHDILILRGGIDGRSPVVGMGTRYVVWKNIRTHIDYAFVYGAVNEGVSHIFSWRFIF